MNTPPRTTVTPEAHQSARHLSQNVTSLAAAINHQQVFVHEIPGLTKSGDHQA
jgi:hypothetical protein